MTLIAEGSGEDEASDIALRRDAVDTYTALLETSRLPPVLMETMSWVLGEYSYLSSTLDLPSIISKLCQLAGRPKLDAPTRRHLTTAVMKLVSQAGTCPPVAATLIDDYTKSQDTDLQQRCLEFQNLLTTAPQVSERESESENEREVTVAHNKRDDEYRAAWGGGAIF